MSEWKIITAEEFCDSVMDGTHDTPKPTESGYKLVTGKHLKKGVIDDTDAYYISESDYNKINEHSKVDQWDVLMSMIGTVGEVAVVKNKPCYAIKNVALFKCAGSELKGRWLAYYLNSPKAKGFFTGNQKGSSQQFLSLKQLRNLPILVTEEPYMKYVVDILSRYDSLIENYQKQIKLHEEAAQRLYKEWFVDLHFPGHENTNILDGVPEGWEKKKLCEFTGITDGTHDSPKQVEIGLPLVTGRCIVDGSIDFSQAYNISEEDVIKINKRSAVEDGDILLSNIGTIGKVCRISKSGNYAVKNMIIFKPHDAIHSCFLHRFLTDNNTQMDFLQQAAGTSQKFVSLSFIRNTLILRPSDTILNLFYNHSEKYFNYVQILQSQLCLLTEARDRLLPKLMSGEIEI